MQSETVEGWTAFLETVESWGPQTNREKTLGFSKKINDGVTTVKLNYSFEVEQYGIVYEALVLIKRPEGYRILICLMNQDKKIVAEGTKQY